MDNKITLYYAVVGVLYLVYFLALYRSHKKGSMFTFYNISVIYYFVFFFIPFGVVVTGQNYKHASFEPTYYWMSFYYSVLVVFIGIIYNLTLSSRRVGSLWRDAHWDNGDVIGDIKDRHVLFFVTIKFALLFFGFTPFQLLILSWDVSAAHALQKEMHTTSGYTVLGLFYGFVGPVSAIIFIARACSTRNHIYRFVLLFLAVETSAWYFSKSGFAVAIFSFFVLYFWGKKVNFLALSVISISVVYAAFSLRLGTFFEYSYVWENFTKRLVSETGYSLIHLQLINEAGPPLSFTDRYYLGFRTLFGIEPAGNWSREAFYLENGRWGGTTSGYSAVYLYAFWGGAWVIVAPLLLWFISRVDAGLIKKVRASFFLRTSYIFISLLFVNAVTVNLTRVVDYRFVLNPKLAINMAIIAFVYLFFIKKNKIIK